jgi:hypothetical protein
MAEPEYIRELRALLCEWDPIGVFAVEPNWSRDEYDSLIGPLLARLQGGADAGGVQDYLTGQLNDYFGIDAPLTTPVFAERVAAWYADYRARPLTDERLR